MSEDEDPTQQVTVAPRQTPPPSLLDVGHDFAPSVGAGSVKARVWAHPSADGAGPRPLVIYLHGNNGGGYYQQDFPQLYGPPTENGLGQGTQGKMHVGKLLSHLIDAKTVGPLVVACPSMMANSSAMWGPAAFDLESFVQDVVRELAALASLPESDPEHAKVEIALDRVAVTGHSGAGGAQKDGKPVGLGLVASKGGTFTVDGTTHSLAVLGIMDTKTTKDFADTVRQGLAANATTAVYAVFRKGMGGWGGSFYDPKGYWAGLSGQAVDSRTPHFAGDSRFEDTALVVPSLSYGDPTATPLRLAIGLDNDNAAAFAGYRSRWSSTPGAFKHYRIEASPPGRPKATDFGHHFDAVGVWSEWAARRFFAT